MTIAATDEAVHVRAPGKVNLFMRVGEVQSDGYHDVATAYQAVSLYEDVRAWPDDEFSVSFSGSIDTSGLPTDASNLAIRAAKLLARTAGVPGGVHLEIEKHVPIAGGMGGGSADAAATLVACDAMWGTALSKEELHALAAKLGADVPFALTGGTAIGTGPRRPAEPRARDGVVPLGARRRRVRALDARRLPRARPAPRRGPASRRRRRDAHASTPSVLQALRAGDPRLLADALHNDLQPAALGLAPGPRRHPRARRVARRARRDRLGVGTDRGVPRRRRATRRSSCRSPSRRRASTRCTCTDRCTAPASCTDQHDLISAT